jgi:hypothetical protein
VVQLGLTSVITEAGEGNGVCYSMLTTLGYVGNFSKYKIDFSLFLSTRD